MKPFDLEKAKAGEPVCTRDGRDVRIICFDRKHKDYPIIALVDVDGKEEATSFTNDGKFNQATVIEDNSDLLMKPQKRSGWINIYPIKPDDMHVADASNVYATNDAALIGKGKHCISTIEIHWEE